MPYGIKTKTSKQTSVQVRLDKKTKEEAEIVFYNLGLTSSQAITLFYKQVALKKGIPFELTIGYWEDISDRDFLQGQKQMMAKDLQEAEAEEDGEDLFNEDDIKPLIES